MSTAVTDELGGDILQGVRMTAEEFLGLPESKNRYELINGVVFMSPAPSLLHQDTVAEIIWQFKTYLASHPVGRVFPDIDVNLGPGPTGGDVIYRPDVVYVSRKRMMERTDRLTCIPCLVIEVVSPGTRNLDRRTKRSDYERAGVPEYWLIDPERRTMSFYRLSSGKYSEAQSQDNAYATPVIAGFVLDLAGLRRVFEGG